MSAIKLEKVSKVYPDGNRTVYDLSLTVEEGEFVTVTGPSSSGKTSLIRMIAGLEEVTAGELYLGDKLANDLPVKDRGIAMIFQNDSLAPQLSVYENLAYGLRIRKNMQAAEEEYIEKRVLAVAALFGLTELLLKKPKQLTGWQRQRVALGRAVVRDPKLYLFDEPFSNLDGELRARMLSDLGKLQARLGATFFYATSDIREAMSLGSRVAVLKDGFLQQIATPRCLYEAPVNRFVASYLVPGTALFDGCPLTLGEEPSVEVRGVKIALPQDISSRLTVKEDCTVTVAFRPEDLTVGKEGIPARVKGKEGDCLVLEAGGADFLARGEGSGEVFLVPDAAHILLFDGETERSVLMPTAEFGEGWAFPPTPAEMRAFSAKPKAGKKK